MFSHMSNNCLNKHCCEYCGKNHPFQQPCSQESFCVNCNISGHPSTSRECPNTQKKIPNKPLSFSSSKLLPLIQPVMNCGTIKWKIAMMESSCKKLTTTIARLQEISKIGTSYEGEIGAIKLRTDYAFQNIAQANSLFFFTDSQSAIKAIMAQSRESYHNETITKIRDNLIQISSLVEHIKLIYCPAHKSI